MANLNRLKQQMTSQLEEAKRTADEEGRERQSLAAQLRNAEHEIDGLREQLDEAEERKSEMQRLLSKANGEVQQWRARFEAEGLGKADEVEVRQNFRFGPIGRALENDPFGSEEGPSRLLTPKTR